MRFCVFAALAALTAAPAFAENAAQMQHADHCGLPAGDGAVKALDVAKARVTIAHEAIEALRWTKATTEIAVSKSVDLAAFAEGDTVQFLVAAEKKGKPAVIVAMCATEADSTAQAACMASMHKTAMKVAALEGKECGAGHEGHGKKPKDGHSGHH